MIEGFYPTSADAGVTLPRVRRFVIIVAVALGLAYAIGIPAFLERDDDPLPPKADAIVVLAGSENRLPAAEALFEGLAVRVAAFALLEPPERKLQHHLSFTGALASPPAGSLGPLCPPWPPEHERAAGATVGWAAGR